MIASGTNVLIRRNKQGDNLGYIDTQIEESTFVMDLSDQFQHMLSNMYA
jgi:hypothetical protein